MPLLGKGGVVFNTSIGGAGRIVIVLVSVVTPPWLETLKRTLVKLPALVIRFVMATIWPFEEMSRRVFVGKLLMAAKVLGKATGFWPTAELLRIQNGVVVETTEVALYLGSGLLGTRVRAGMPGCTVTIDVMVTAPTRELEAVKTTELLVPTLSAGIPP